MSRPPTPIRPDDPGRGRRLAGIAIAIVVITIAVLALGVFLLRDLLVDRLWFQSVGQLPVWELRTFGRIALFIPVALVVFAILALSLVLPLRGMPAAVPRLRAERARTRTVQGPFGPVEQADLLLIPGRDSDRLGNTIKLEIAELLGIPYDKHTQAGLFPIAYTKGTDFKPADRSRSRVRWNGWNG